MLPRRGACSMHAACSNASDLCPWVKRLRNFESVWFYVLFWKSFPKYPANLLFASIINWVEFDTPLCLLTQIKPKNSKLYFRVWDPWEWPQLICNRWAARLCVLQHLITITLGCPKHTNCASLLPHLGKMSRIPLMLHCLTVPTVQIILTITPLAGNTYA